LSCKPLIGRTHQYFIKGKTYTVDRFYVMDSEPIGAGAYGDVCTALDIRTYKKIAIKKNYKCFS